MKIDGIKKYPRSICSTCINLSHCMLTTDKSNISSCSEYVHLLDKDFSVAPLDTVEMFSGSGQTNNFELILN